MSKSATNKLAFINGRPLLKDRPHAKKSGITWSIKNFMDGPGDNWADVESMLKKSRSFSGWRWDPAVRGKDVTLLMPDGTAEITNISPGDTITISEDGRIAIEPNPETIVWSENNRGEVVRLAKRNSKEAVEFKEDGDTLYLKLGNLRLTMWPGDRLTMHNGWAWVENARTQTNGEPW